MKLYRSSRNISAFSNQINYSTKYWRNLIDKIESLGYEVDSADKFKPVQWITAYKDGKEYEIEVNRYSDGTYEITNSNLIESSKVCSKINTPISGSSDIDDDLDHPNQEYDSANTSINSIKLPAIYRLVDFHPGDVVLDYGGGKFDNAVNHLADMNITLLVYDPYNRSAEHNREVVKILRQNGGADAAVCSNVLNVIKEPEARLAVLKNIQKLTKSGGDVYITVYEGSGKGDEGPTKSGYQLNRKTEGYLGEIREVFPNAKRKGKLVYATNTPSVNSSMYQLNYTTPEMKQLKRALSKIVVDNKEELESIVDSMINGDPINMGPELRALAKAIDNSVVDSSEELKQLVMDVAADVAVVNNWYCKKFNPGDKVKFYHGEGKYSDEVGTVQGFDDDGFYVIRWPDKTLARGISDDNLISADDASVNSQSTILSSSAYSRIAKYGEFDNGYVMHDDWKKMSTEAAEQLAMQKSIEDPEGAYYVQFDDLMNPSSDYVWINGIKYLDSDVTYEYGKPHIRDTKVEASEETMLTICPSCGGNKFNDVTGLCLDCGYDEKSWGDIDSASYGGAYDILDDQYFSRDDILQFGDALCELLSDEYNKKFDISDLYIDDNNNLYIELECDDYTVFDKVAIDMRRIREPSDIMKYTDEVLDAFKSQISAYISSAVKSASDEYDYRDVVSVNNHKYAVRYTHVDTAPNSNVDDMWDNFKFQISRIAPYDDADYAWLEGSQGTVKLYRDGKLIDKTFYMDADDMGIENNEWCDAIIQEAVQLLEQYNHAVDPHIVNSSIMSPDIKSLQDSLYNVASEYLKNNLDWSLKDVDDMLIIEVNELDDNEYRIEIRAELDYDWLYELIEALNPVIWEYDNEAYFDMVSPGIAEAYIREYKHHSVNSRYYPEPPLEPDEPEGVEIEDAGDILHIDFDNVEIELNDADWWEYMSEDWAKENGKFDTWWSESVQSNMYHKDDIIEAVDILIAPYMPRIPGKYVINGSADLFFVIEGAYRTIYEYWEDDNGVDYDDDIDVSNATVEFDSYNSKIDVTITPVE